MASFIITADWHIGSPMESAGEAAEYFRSVRFNTAEEIIKMANKEKIDAIFILGDLFDGDNVGETDIRKTSIILSKAKCPIYIIPGNHDWWHLGGSLHSFSQHAAKHDNITLLLEEEPLTIDEIKGIIFYSGPVMRKIQIKDPTEWIPKRKKGDGVRVGLFHGSIDSTPGGLIPTTAKEDRNLDYLILGDWHNPTEFHENSFYCGSIEPMGFDEPHKGQIILAKTTKEKIELTPIDVGKLSWNRYELELSPKDLGGQGIDLLKEKIESIENEANDTAIRLHLRGSLSWEEHNELDEYLADLEVMGWGCVGLGNIEIDQEGDANIEELPPSIQKVAEDIINSGEEDIVIRKAISILSKKMGAIE